MTLIVTSSFGATSVTLAWNKNTEPDVVGYRVYYGAVSRKYTNITNVGIVTSNRVSGLVAGVKYYFAVTAYDSDGFESDFSDEIAYLMPTTLNQAPTISLIFPQITSEGVSVTVPFNVADADTTPATLTLSAASSNPQLVPVSSIVFGGSGSNRTANIAPAPYQSGNATLTFFVSDGSLTNSSTFTLTVNAVNNPPSISSIAPQVIAEDTATAVIPFTVGDVDNVASNLIVTASSSNPTLVPVSGVILGGASSNRTVQVLPTSNQSGSSTVTLTVSDGALSSRSAFLVTVSPVNDAPIISSIPPQVVNEDSSTSLLPILIGDSETAASNLVLSATSSNPSLVPISSISFGGSGSNRTVKVLPATNQFGTSTITVQLSDGSQTSSTSFLLTVNPVNDTPEISVFKDVVVSRGTSTGPIPFTVGDVETMAGNLTVAATSSNPYLVPTYNILFGGSASNRTATINPYRRRTGQARITIQVSDGLLTRSNSFLVTVSTGGATASPAPDAQMLAADLYGNSVTVSWATSPNGIYRLLATTNIAQPVWVQVTSDIKAVDVVTSWMDTVTNGPSRFYRVQRVQ